MELVNLSRRDTVKIARRFNAGWAISGGARVLKGRLNLADYRMFSRAFGTGCLVALEPGVKTPGYFQTVPSGLSVEKMHRPV